MVELVTPHQSPALTLRPATTLPLGRKFCGTTAKGGHKYHFLKIHIA